MQNKTYIQLHFKTVSTEQVEILIALLYNIGFTGFEEAHGELNTFVDKNNFNSIELDEVLAIVPMTCSVTEIAEENWNAKWEHSFEPIMVNNFVAIRASFHQPIPTVQHEIIITPKMSFGTGHHATTFLVLAQMEKIGFTGKTVLDFGAGTGVLAILAEKMGALQITAIDNDDWSIENAIENRDANNCKRIFIEKAEAIPANQQFDIIVANINLNVILANISAMAQASTKGTTILLSGFLKADESMLITALENAGFNEFSIQQKGEWIMIQARY